MFPRFGSQGANGAGSFGKTDGDGGSLDRGVSVFNFHDGSPFLNVKVRQDAVQRVDRAGRDSLGRYFLKPKFSRFLLQDAFQNSLQIGPILTPFLGR